MNWITANGYKTFLRRTLKIFIAFFKCYQDIWHIDREAFFKGNRIVWLITNSKIWIALTAHLSVSCYLPIHPSASISMHVCLSRTTDSMCVCRVAVCTHVFAVWLHKPGESRELSEGGCPGFFSKKDEHNPRGLCRRFNLLDYSREKHNHQNKLPNWWNSPPKLNKVDLIVVVLINTSIFSFHVMHLNAPNLLVPIW